MSRNLNGGRARDGKAEEPLRFGPERKPQGGRPQRRPPGLEKGVYPEGAGNHGTGRTGAPG